MPLTNIPGTSAFIEAATKRGADTAASYCQTNGISTQAGLDADIDALVDAVFATATAGQRAKLKGLFKLSVAVVIP